MVFLTLFLNYNICIYIYTINLNYQKEDFWKTDM